MKDQLYRIAVKADFIYMQSEDFEIIKRIQNGEIDIYRIIVEKYNGFVFAVLSKRLPLSEVDELAQTVFISAFKSINTFSDSGKFKNWLAVIAAREVYEYWKKKEKERAVVENCSTEDENCSIDIMGINEALERYKDASDLQYYTELTDLVLKRLGPEDRTLVETVYFERWKLKDAASIFKWGLVKTKIRAMRARNKMRNILSEILGGECDL